MELQGALGLAELFLGGEARTVEGRLRRALDLAAEDADAWSELRFLSAMHLFCRGAGNYAELLDLARRSEAVAARLEDPGDHAAADSMLSVAHHLTGDPRVSERYAQQALLGFSAAHHRAFVRLGFDHRPRALVAVARNQWLFGHTERALAAAHYALDEAAATKHPVTIAAIIACTLPVFLWIGDLSTAEAIVNQLEDLATKNVLEPYRQIAVGFRGSLSIHRGEAETGVRLIETVLSDLHRLGHRMTTVEFMIDLAGGLMALGCSSAALAVVERGLATIGAQGETFLLPEMLRLRGEILAQLGDAAPESPEPSFVRAVELARRQGAEAWALRATVSLTRYLERTGRAQEAVAPLEHAIRRVDRRSATSDLRDAIALFDQLQGTTGRM
jgi:tetratricopeptide (TPR) repeat protein